ncbi:DUF4376 domain-containing protein [Escherichia coli]|uniref:DUF4376 domain-containing protein n=1 Tax=Escherichia coli TaxID=562 RepID=UPI001EFC97E4|nr:DUF4376 domain-containing protein [Escherichia coli]MCG9429978.1 DUF4376 domain-containing protein [Escherichia coli]
MVKPPFSATPEMLEREKVVSCEEINLWRDQQESIEYLMEFNGRRWDYGKRKRERISTSLTVARNGPLLGAMFSMMVLHFKPVHSILL